MPFRTPEILTAPPPVRLIEAIAQELALESPSLEAIAEHVRRYALEAFARLVPPERMLVSLKAIVAEAAPDAGPRERAEFVARLIPYALEGYFLDGWMRRTGQPVPVMVHPRRGEVERPASD